LFLKSSDKDHGLEVFRRLGVPKDAWFISVHVREGDDRRCTSNSNATLENYKKAFKVITDRGGWVIRMGHKGMTPLQPMERCIDYANSDYKSESMDVFLWASCLFFIGSSSGPLSVPPTFGRRVLYTNCPCIGQNQFYPGSIFLPKLYWSNTENRLLTFPEMMASSIGWTVSSVFDDFDGSILENTDEEIADAVNEMFTLSELKPDQSLSELQMRFNNLRLRYSDYGQTTISQSFIEKYQSLLS
jgi:putative glycosyltransferase (TIGR04372 family)